MKTTRLSIFIAIFTFFAILMPSTTFAQTKVGVVNVQLLLKESKSAKSASNRLKKEFSGREKNLKKLAETVKKLQDDLERNSATMSDTVRRKKEREVTDKTVDLRRKQREFTQDLAQRQSTETGKVIDKAQNIINDIAKKEGFDLILRDAVYASPQSDITDKVLRELDR